MAIGILSALEAIEGNARPDDNSVVPPIDRLASLPQAFIMQMAQKGQIPKSMVAPVLAKKAENAQLGMQMQAAMQKAQTGGAPPSTVIEKVIAQNAAQETAPVMDRSNVGVASAPMRPDMYKRGMAGGGIVAFKTGGFTDYLKKFGLTEKDAASYGITSENYNKPGASFPINITGVGKDEKQSGPIGVISPSESDPNFYDRQARRQAIINAEREKLLNSQSRVNEKERGPTEKEIDELMKEVFPKKELTSKKVTTDNVASVTAEQVSNEVRENNKEIKKLIDNINTGENKDTSTENIVEEIKQEQGGNKNKPPEPKEFVGLSGDDVAMLGLQFGLELLGTDQQNFFTALGKAGKPALKTALALKQEKKKQAFTKSEREAGQKFQLDLQDKKQAGAEKIAELQAKAPTKIQKIAKDLAKIRGRDKVNFLDLFDASKVVGAGASVDAALAGLASKGVDAGAKSYAELIGPGGTLYGLEKVRVGTAKAKDLEPSIQDMINSTKQALAKQQNVSPDSVSDAQAASIILNQRREQEISQGLSAAGTGRETINRMVEERFPSGNILDYSDLK